MVGRIIRILGIDGALSYGISTQIWTMAGGLVTIYLVAHLLSASQQGFFYTFRSLLAMQVFVELGLSAVLSTFFSHEFSGLSWGPGGTIEGLAEKQFRYLDLLVRSVKWFACAAAVFILALVPAGLAFFGQQRGSSIDFAWRGAWIFAVLSTGAFLLLTPLFAGLMGSGDVHTANALWFWGGLAGSFLAWTSLLTGHGLAAVAALSLGNAVVGACYFGLRKPRLLAAVWRGLRGHVPGAARTPGVSWRHEVWPMQWRIAVSWLSGYFIFQLFTPVLFQYQGAIVAGQMGMTMSLVNALLAIGLVWVNVKGPAMAMLIAERRWRELDQLFLRVLLRATGFAVLGCLSAVAGLYGLDQMHLAIAQRILPVGQVALLLAAVVVLVTINALACYLRAHKQEPLMVMSVTTALLQGAATWYCAMRYSSAGMCVAFLVTASAFSLPFAYVVWRRCRRTWHSGSKLEVFPVRA